MLAISAPISVNCRSAKVSTLGTDWVGCTTSHQTFGPIMVHLFVHSVPNCGFGEPSAPRSFNQLPLGVGLSRW